MANNPSAIRPVVAHPALVDGGDAAGDAVHRRVHGGVAGKLPPARGDPPSAGHHDFDSGRRPVGEPDVHHAAAVSADHVPSEKDFCLGIGTVALHLDVRPAAGGLGHVVGGPLSHRHVWTGASAADPAGKPDALCGIAQNTHDSRLSAVRDFSRPPQRGAVPHTHHSRPALEPHGSVANPFPQKQ